MATLASPSPLTPTPGHIPDSAVFDFDMFGDPALKADPHARILELSQAAPPVFWTPRNGGHWVFFGKEAVFDGARDAASFSSEPMPHEQLLAMLAMMPKGSPHVPIPYPILLDPPLHEKYRQPLQTVFSPKTVSGLKAKIRDLAVDLIDPVVAQGRCEFMSAVAEPLPVQIFLKMLGLPLEMMPEYRALVKENFAAQASDANPAAAQRMMKAAGIVSRIEKLLGKVGLSLQMIPPYRAMLNRRLSAQGPDGNMAAMQRLMKVAAIMRDEILDRRDNPRDDILSMLWKVEIDGKPMTLDDMENYGVLLFIAGLDTVMNAIGYAVRHLAENPDLQDRLRAEPVLIPKAAEEMLRLYSFVVPVRRVSHDLEFKGVQMKANERVMLYLPGASLDPAAYSDPGTYDLDRDNKSHIAFNAGPHRCLGAHLARLELQTLYEELLTRLPRFRLDPDKPVEYLCSHILGIDKLHIVWDD
ncbi:cytochrome P450 [Novosphingobium album (ex Hu et al. 2023)]|uniref:Cytochrome P450 n=1 Tax=Novosphingobium album (ex Hu et al. 2023) TaxID=2930093 RepID=A0ABT0B032_9SPHN|nr:cytochrome P450 [Novosphingobium album (ex Hu et al. 2023)]MCJ2178392.1 cytochrome P450 [Novosphingobium album (ex Hu et al. 2023)]